MAEAMMMATVAVAGLDSALSVGLMAVYARSYSRVRAPFTLGLLVFGSLFLAQNILAVYAYASMMELFPAAVAPYMLGIMVTEGAALAGMLYSASR